VGFLREWKNSSDAAEARPDMRDVESFSEQDGVISAGDAVFSKPL